MRSRDLRSQRVVDGVVEQLANLDGTVVEIACQLLERVRELNERIKQLERQITLHVIRLAPSLLAIPGCGALPAGTAPRPSSSGSAT